jgi:L-cystine uptake protein TcyP (sodium:dicarboxylate symporter family)
MNIGFWWDAFMILVIFSFIGGVAYGQITKEDLQPEHVQQEAVLISSIQKGKVKTYRVVDTELQMVCYVTVGELHGKTVAQDCFSLRSLGTSWVFEGGTE